MTTPSQPISLPSLEDHPWRGTDSVRYADLDPNQHVNNAVYASYLEGGRVSLVRDPARGLTLPGCGWVLANLSINFRAELHWPAPIETGLGVIRLGRTSVTFSQVVFSQGRCIASAEATTVMVDSRTRKPSPLPPDLMANFQPWFRRDCAPGIRRC